MIPKTLSGNRNARKTVVKPKKKMDKDSKRYALHKQAKATLGVSQNLKTAVKLPPGENLDEWMASHAIDFFNQANLLFGSIEEFCDETTCPEMRAGPNYTYLWADEKIRKPIACPAKTYVDYLFTWIQAKFDDENLFPTTMDKPFPKHFKGEIQQIIKKLFRVFAHIYIHHFDNIKQLNEEAHINASFKHFLYFVDEFKLMEAKDMAPLADLIETFRSGENK